MTREDWLLALVGEVRPLFAAAGHTLPDRIRVTCGFPSNARRSGAIGECWASAASADAHYEVLISPTLADPVKVAEVLVHELCHTLPGAMNHGAAFGRAAAAMHLAPGLKGWKTTVQAAGFGPTYGALIDGLGPYPHATLTMDGQKTKQTTRMLKAHCPTCRATGSDYIIRLTRKHADRGLPLCAIDGDTFALDSEGDQA